MGLPRHTSDITGHNQAVNVMADNDKPETGRRLESWKEIAAFFGRDERTVHRWEKDLGLPVHRLPGTKGRVYAFSQELASWSTKPKDAVVEDVPEVVAVLDVPAARPSHPRLIFVVATGVVLAVLAFAVPLIKSRWHGVDRNREAEDLYLKGRYVLLQCSVGHVSGAVINTGVMPRFRVVMSTDSVSATTSWCMIPTRAPVA